MRLRAGDEEALISNSLLRNAVRSRDRRGGNETRLYGRLRPPLFRVLRLLVDCTIVLFYNVHPAIDITVAIRVNMVEEAVVR